MGDSHLYETNWSTGGEPWLQVPSANSWPKVATWGTPSFSYEPQPGTAKNALTPSKVADTTWTNSWLPQNGSENPQKPKIGFEKAGTLQVEPLVNDFRSLSVTNQEPLEALDKSFEFAETDDDSEFATSFASATPSELQSPEQRRNNKKKLNIEEELSKQSLYKTELCRSYQDTGACRYGQKCQFAHGEHELRPILRHPKYKTEYCQRFAIQGHCPYGNRCRFIHPSSASSGFKALKQDMKKAISAEPSPTKRNSVPLLDITKVNEVFSSFSSPNSPSSANWSSTWQPTNAAFGVNGTTLTREPSPVTPQPAVPVQSVPVKDVAPVDYIATSALDETSVDPTSVAPIAPPQPKTTPFALNPWTAPRTPTETTPSPTTSVVKSSPALQLVNEGRPHSAEGRRLNVFQNLAT